MGLRIGLIVSRGRGTVRAVGVVVGVVVRVVGVVQVVGVVRIRVTRRPQHPPLLLLLP